MNNRPFIVSGDESKGEGWAAEERDFVVEPGTLPLALPLRIHETWDGKHRYVFRVRFFRFGRDEVLFEETQEPLYWVGEEDGEIYGVVSWVHLREWVVRRANGSVPVAFPQPLGFDCWKVREEVEETPREPAKGYENVEEAEFEEIDT